MPRTIEQRLSELREELYSEQPADAAWARDKLITLTEIVDRFVAETDARLRAAHDSIHAIDCK